MAGALALTFFLLSCSRTERRRAELLARDFRSYESPEFSRELSDRVAALPLDDPSDVQNQLALSCARHTQALFSAMRAKDQREAASEALTGYIVSCQLFAAEMRASVDSLSQGQAAQTQTHMATAKMASSLGELFYKVLTPLAMYSPAGDRMSIFESMARAYPVAQKDTAQRTLAALMQGVYAEEDRASNRSRMRQLLQQAGISLPPAK